MKSQPFTPARGDDAHIHAHLGTTNHQAVAHVEAGISNVGEGHLVEGFAGMLLHGEEVGENLRGMALVGQAVPHGDASVFGQFLNSLLLEATVLDAVEHATQHAGGVLHALLHANLATGGAQIGDVSTLVFCTNLEGAASAGGGLLENQGDVLAFQGGLLGAGILGAFQVASQVEQIVEFLDS